MAHELENFIYNKASQYQDIASPWHGLGFPVDSSTMSPEEMIIAGKMDWSVSTRNAYVRVSRDAKDGMMQVQGVKHVMRDHDNMYYQTVSNRYACIQNKEIVSFFSRYCESGDMKIETIGTVKDGAIIFAMASLNTGFNVAGDKNDLVHGKLLLAASHDGSMNYQGMYTSVSVVCMNTLQMALTENKKGNNTLFRTKHTTNWRDNVADAHAKLEEGRQATELLKERANYLASVKINFRSDDTEKFIHAVVGKGVLEMMEEKPTYSNPLDAVVDSMENEKPELNRVGRLVLESICWGAGQDTPSRKNTAWGLVNGVTHYVDHVAARNPDNRLKNAFFGAGNDMKNKAMEVVLQMTGGR